MASSPLFYDRVLETSTTTGTGTYTLAGAVTGYQAWSVVSNGNSAQYYAEDVDANGVPSGGWEVGVGTYTASGTTLSRDKILASSNSGSAVSWSAGTRRIGLVQPVAASAIPEIASWGGRLTLETGVPVSTTDQLAKGHLFYTPYLHNRTPKWNGSSWERVTFTEYDLTLTLTSGKNYDVFWNGSALSLSSAWTNDTTRADALGTQDGVPCLGSDHTKLLVGTIRASATNQTADSGGVAQTNQVGATRFVWNLYNQVQRPIGVLSTSGWSYALATIRQAGGIAGMKVEVIVGAVASPIDVTGALSCGIVAGKDYSLGLGEDSTTAPIANADVYANLGGAISGTQYCMFSTRYCGTIPLGYHYYALLEAVPSANSATVAGSDTTHFLGMRGWFVG